MQNTDRLCMGCMNDNGGEQVCPICGYDKDSPQNASFLSTRTWLKERYCVGKVLDSNGEGVSYIGWDNESDTVIKVREYCPTGLCERRTDGSVAVTEGSEYTYNEGLLGFMEMARTLSGLKDVPALMNIYDIFEANGTAYYVVQTVAGITLREFLLRNGGVLKWEQARPLFMPLISSLASIHAAGIIHRGISPDTLSVGRDGIIRITDFCIPEARTARSDMTAQLFPGFAAIEQYGFDGQQGQWTDVYGIAATLFRTLVGTPPPEATERVTDDHMTIPGKIAQELPQYVLTALANALQILPEDRTQTVDSFKADLMQSGDFDEYDEEYEDYVRPKGAKRYGVIAAVATIVLVFVVFGVLAVTVFKDTFFPDREVTQAEQPTSSLASLLPMESNEKLYDMPNLVGSTYAQVAANVDYISVFQFEIESAVYSDEYERGYIIEQTPAAGEAVPRGETVKLKISLGSSSVSMPNLSGMTEEEAIIELMKMGFFYDSITVMETYDTDAAAEKVVETDPKAGVTVNPAGSVKIFVNTYVEESSSAPASTSRPVSTISRPSSSSSAASTSSSASTSSPSDTTTSRSEED
ncbi:MAG: PASTA domain-containing protein [Candidatus Howiella sp.]